MQLEKYDILFEDNHLLVVNKKAGIPVQGDESGDPSLVDYAREYIRKKYSKPGNVFVGLAHRIDRPASGIVLLCKTSKSLTRVTQAFKAREVKKTYRVIVTARPPEQKGRLVHWLLKDKSINKVQVFIHEKEGTLRSELEYEILDSKSGKYLLSVNLITGRPHQIRAQLSKIKCPVAADVKYGATEQGVDKNIYLHSYSMELDHPVKKTPLRILAPMPVNGLWALFRNDKSM